VSGVEVEVDVDVDVGIRCRVSMSVLGVGTMFGSRNVDSALVGTGTTHHGRQSQ
jgi:hypothetical protein